MRLKRDQAIIFGAMFLWAVGMGLFNYLWPVYTRQLGAGNVELGFLFSLSFVVTTLANIPGGALADRYDHKWVIVTLWWVAVPSAVIYALAQDWRALIPGVLLFNISNALTPALQAYVAETADKGRMASTFSFVYAAFPLGMVISPAIGGWFAQTHGIRPVFWLTVVFYVASSALLHFLTPHPPVRVERFRQARQDPPKRSRFPSLRDPLLRMSVFFGIVMGIWNLALPFSTPYLEDVAHVNLFWVGILGSAASLGAALLAPLLGRLADRRGLRPTLAWSLGAQAVPLSLWLLWPGSLPALTASMFLRGIQDGSRGIMTSMVGHHLSEPAGASGKEMVGRGFAAYNIVTGTFQAATPYVGGWLYSVTPTLPFLASLASLIIAALYSRRVIAGSADGRV
ncbi:MAG: MFS transporter [Symbiobacteriia bacterium]